MGPFTSANRALLRIQADFGLRYTDRRASAEADARRIAEF